MSALSDIVAALTGPDREVDGAIACAIGLLHPRDFITPTTSVPPSPEYTRIIDAAMTVVPEGCGWEVTTTGFKPGASVVRFRYPAEHHGSYAATPALALLCAALKARDL